MDEPSIKFKTYLECMRSMSCQTIESIVISRVARNGFGNNEWKLIKEYANWVLEVREKALLSTFFQKYYVAGQIYNNHSVSAEEVLKKFNNWKNSFTEEEQECIIHSSDDLMEYLLMFAPDKSIKYEIYYGFVKR